MAIDAGIFQNALRPPPTVQDYDAANQAFQQNALKIQSDKQGIADQNALRQATMQMGNDPGQNLQTLRQAGLFAPSQAYQAAIYNNANKQSDTTKNLASANEQDALGSLHQTQQKIDATNFHLQQLQGINDISQIPGWVADGVKSGVQDFSSSQQGLQQFLASAQQNGLDTAKAQAMQGGQSVAETLKQQQAAQLAQLAQQGDNSRNAATNQAHLQGVSMTQGAENARSAASRANQLTIAGLNSDGSFAGSNNPDDTDKQLNFWADVVKKGGTLPPGLARGVNGSAFVREVAKRAAMGDTTPSDLMSNQAEFGGAKAGQRTLGTKQANTEMAANEAYNMIPIAVAASNKVDRTNFPSLNAVLQAAERGSGDTNVVQLAAATNSLVNSYTRAISPSGTPTVSDKEHAREILDTAFSKGQFGAATDIMRQEIEAARNAPTQVRANMRSGSAGSASPAANSLSVPTPDGQVHTFPTASAAAQFRKAAGL